jgi:hypothetical protein
MATIQPFDGHFYFEKLKAKDMAKERVEGETVLSAISAN